ncbi:MAG: transcriptional regulator, family [Devosia sp.]|uniref:helix-turn-helix transcriptional regulator n=1 Tax=Devosia sp. TaxID=1871048 RepID=UPI00261FE641|nr:helix-turn-helix transcriptional regulator [Devosia sp.]MDB5538975.1 transcriptional regulator, family [Devosia sp.]
MPQRTLARDRGELATFLRDRREALSPLDVGLPPSGRRRTPGLRREEVASLAGVGLTWYTWFEQGRSVTVSTAFLENVARALRLDAAEYAHLFSLAGHGVPTRESGAAKVPPVILQLMSELVDRPAFVKDAHWDILAWNAASTYVLGDFDQLPAAHRNSLWLTFADTSFRRSMVDWESDARRIVGRFRADHAKSAKDARLAELVSELERESPEFREVWREYAVLDRESGIRNINVKGIGPTRFHYTVLAVEGARGLKLVLYSPDPTDDAARRFAAQMLLNAAGREPVQASAPQ